MRLAALICAAACAAFGQVDGVNVSVARGVNIQPDQAEFTAIVATTLDTTQEQVAKIFQDAGAPSPNVVNVAAGANSSTYPPSSDSQLFFQVTFTASVGALRDLAKKLDVVRASPPQGVSSVQYVAALTASVAAVESMRKTLLPQLLAEARAKAQGLAEVAGLILGAITGVSENYYATGNAVNAYFLVTPILGNSSTTSAGSQYTFSAYVKFATQ